MPAFDTGGTSSAAEALAGGAPEPSAANGRSFFFDPFEETLENATRIYSEAPVWSSPRSDAALVTGGVMKAWIEEKEMENERRKGNGWSHCSHKVFLESDLRARYQNVPSSILGRETSLIRLPGSRGGTQVLTEP